MTRFWLATGAAVLVAGALAWVGTSKVIAAKGTADDYLSWNAGQSGVVTTKSGLQYKVLEPGDGKEKPGDADVAAVAYRGTLQDGSVFDENPRATFPVKDVVPGFSEALKLMPRKSKFRVWMPPKLAYGENPPPNSPIKANAMLVFDITMEDFKSRAEVEAMQKMMQQMQGAQGGQPGGPPQGMPGQ